MKKAVEMFKLASDNGVSILFVIYGLRRFFIRLFYIPPCRTLTFIVLRIFLLERGNVLFHCLFMLSTKTICFLSIIDHVAIHKHC